MTPATDGPSDAGRASGDVGNESGSEPAPRRSAKASGWMFHPLLVPLLPVLFLYVNNVAEIAPSQLPVPLGVLIAITLVFWTMGRLVFGSWGKGALAASWSLVFLMFYRYARESATLLIGRDIIGRKIGIPVWGSLYLTGVCFIWRTHRVALSNRVASVFTLLLILMQGGTLLAHNLWKPASVTADSLEVDNRQWTLPAAEELPDIYYFILDGYPRADVLQEVYGFDNREFVEALKARGFFVAQQATSNYPATKFSLRTSLNLDYYTHPRDGTGHFEIPSNRVASQLKKIGYRYVLVPSGCDFSEYSPLADETLDVGINMRSELGMLLVEWSLASTITNASSFRDALGTGRLPDLTGVQAWHDHIQHSVEAVGRVRGDRSPVFVFAHVLCPHPPFTFSRDGSVNHAARMTDFSELGTGNPWDDPQFANQVAALNHLLLPTIDRILMDRTRPAIIILQGDHGSARQQESLPADGAAWDYRVRERMRILLGCYATGEVRQRLYDELTPVNLFRLIFSAQFGADYPLLPDRNYWTFDGFRDGKDVTEIVTASLPSTQTQTR